VPTTKLPEWQAREFTDRERNQWLARKGECDWLLIAPDGVKYGPMWEVTAMALASILNLKDIQIEDKYVEGSHRVNSLNVEVATRITGNNPDRPWIVTVRDNRITVLTDVQHDREVLSCSFDEWELIGSAVAELVQRRNLALTGHG